MSVSELNQWNASLLPLSPTSFNLRLESSIGNLTPSLPPSHDPPLLIGLRYSMTLPWVLMDTLPFGNSPAATNTTPACNTSVHSSQCHRTGVDELSPPALMWWANWSRGMLPLPGPYHVLPSSAHSAVMVIPSKKAKQKCHAEPNAKRNPNVWEPFSVSAKEINLIRANSTRLDWIKISRSSLCPPLPSSEPQVSSGL